MNTEGTYHDTNSSCEIRDIIYLYYNFTHAVTSYPQLLQLNTDVFHSDQQVVQLPDEAKVALSGFQWALIKLGDWDSHMGSPIMNLTVSPLFSLPPPLLLHPTLISSSAKKFKKVVGKETYSDTLESTPSLEKEKFPQDYFPEVGNVITTLWLTDWGCCRLMTTSCWDVNWQTSKLEVETCHGKLTHRFAGLIKLLNWKRDRAHVI